MSTGIWSAASGAIGQMTALDVSTNNLVNASTPGYRADASVFRQALVNQTSKASPAASASLRYVSTRTSAPDMTAGPIIQTGRELDVAIGDDKGFFVVSTPKGERYTRAGNFQVTSAGALVTAGGDPVLSAARRPIMVDPLAANVSINREGSVIVDGVEGQKLALVTFKNLAGLEKTTGVELNARPEAGPPIAHQAVLETGALEQSNESAISGMADEVSTSRVFDMTAKVIEAFSAIERKAANEIMGR